MIADNNDNMVLTIQKTIGIGSNYLFLRLLTALGTACIFAVAVTIGFSYFGFHYAPLFFVWMVMVAIVFRFIAWLINSYNKAGWIMLIVAIVFFAAAYYFVLLNILPDFGPDLSDVF
ncbi:hypothetical protein QTN47_10135 [Danxiaibacter flavus]|uniref:Uncharacterized protein n=1 Tax=Danxiaibacter flavus TaxID=3049108 RepID=A0ABV3ZF78_9BACT|nr:hypothetical protein QNM32_10135 [Chitinophagaceae bacterium DXS]